MENSSINDRQSIWKNRLYDTAFLPAANLILFSLVILVPATIIFTIRLLVTNSYKDSPEIIFSGFSEVSKFIISVTGGAFKVSDPTTALAIAAILVTLFWGARNDYININNYSQMEIRHADSLNFFTEWAIRGSAFLIFASSLSELDSLGKSILFSYILLVLCSTVWHNPEIAEYDIKTLEEELQYTSENLDHTRLPRHYNISPLSKVTREYTWKRSKLKILIIPVLLSITSAVSMFFNQDWSKLPNSLFVIIIFTILTLYLDALRYYIRVGIELRKIKFRNSSLAKKYFKYLQIASNIAFYIIEAAVCLYYEIILVMNFNQTGTLSGIILLALLVISFTLITIKSFLTKYPAEFMGEIKSTYHKQVETRLENVRKYYDKVKTDTP